MKLLFDENLSHYLVGRLATLFHVRDVGLQRADDQTIWAHARLHGLAIVSRTRTSRSERYSRGRLRR